MRPWPSSALWWRSWSSCWHKGRRREFLFFSWERKEAKEPLGQTLFALAEWIPLGGKPRSFRTISNEIKKRRERLPTVFPAFFMPPLHPLKNLKGFLRPSSLYLPGVADIVSVLLGIVHLGGGVYEQHAFAAAAGRRDICAGDPVYGGTAAAAAIRRGAMSMIVLLAAGVLLLLLLLAAAVLLRR